MALDGAHAAYDNAPGSLRFPLFDVVCGVRARRIGFLAELAWNVRTHEMHRKTHQRALEIAPASCCGSTESRLLCLAGQGRSGNSPYLSCRNDWDVEL